MASADSAERTRRRVALVVAVLANVLFLAALDRLMPAHPYAHKYEKPLVDDVLLVRLIDEPAPLPAIPELVPTDVEPTAVVNESTPPRRPRRSSAARAPVSEASPPKSQPDPATTAALPTTLQLFDNNGQVRVPESSDAPPAPDAFVRPRAGNSDALAQSNPLPYTPTRFEKYFPSVRETLGGELVRKSTTSHAWRTPWGGQISCSFSPLMPMSLFGCGWGYPPHATVEELRAVRVELPPLRDVVPRVLPQSDPPAH